MAITISIYALLSFLVALSLGEELVPSKFVKQNEYNPILGPLKTTSYIDPLKNLTIYWESGHIYNPAAVFKDGQIFLLYRAQSDETPPSPSTIGLATSSNGIKFDRKSSKPVFFPEMDYEKQGTEDPRVVKLPSGQYLMMYSAYDGVVCRLCSAISPDLISWKRLGCIFEGTKYNSTWSKSGALITQKIGNEFVAQSILFDKDSGIPNDKPRYAVFFGDTNIFLAYATEDELMAGRWTPVLYRNNTAWRPVIGHRPGYFDSALTEPGPFAVNNNGRLQLLYNGMNCDFNGAINCPIGSFGNRNFKDLEYSSGMFIAQTSNPFNILYRLDEPFMHVTEPYEVNGLVNNVVFIEGLASLNSNYYLYYGCADSLLAVAKYTSNSGSMRTVLNLNFIFVCIFCFICFFKLILF